MNRSVTIAATITVFATLLVASSLFVSFAYSRLRVGTREHRPIKSTCAIYARLEEGDVVFFSSAKSGSKQSKTIAVVTNSVFYHCAVVVRFGSKKMLMHFIDASDREFFQPEYICREGDGLCISDASRALQQYGSGSLVAVYSILRATHANLNWFALGTSVACREGNIKGYDYSFIASFFLGSDNLQCNSFVGLLLEEAGILPSLSRHGANPGRTYVPGNIMRLMDASGNFKAPVVVEIE